MGSGSIELGQTSTLEIGKSELCSKRNFTLAGDKQPILSDIL